SELDLEKLPQLLELKYHAIANAVQALGAVAHIKNLFVGVQRDLCRRRAWSRTPPPHPLHPLPPRISLRQPLPQFFPAGLLGGDFARWELVEFALAHPLLQLGELGFELFDLRGEGLEFPFFAVAEATGSRGLRLIGGGGL